MATALESIDGLLKLSQAGLKDLCRDLELPIYDSKLDLAKTIRANYDARQSVPYPKANHSFKAELEKSIKEVEAEIAQVKHSIRVSQMEGVVSPLNRDHVAKQSTPQGPNELVTRENQGRSVSNSKSELVAARKSSAHSVSQSWELESVNLTRVQLELLN